MQCYSEICRNIILTPQAKLVPENGFLTVGCISTVTSSQFYHLPQLTNLDTLIIISIVFEDTGASSLVENYC